MFPPNTSGPGGFGGAPYGAPGYGHGHSGQGFGPAPHLPPGGTAPVWTWYVAYTVAMALLYLGCVIGAIGLAVVSADISPRDVDGMPPMVLAVILGAVGLPFLVAFAIAPFLPKKPWAWTYHLILILLSLTSAACMLAGVPLLIYWLKPETKAMFGKSPY